jgi:tubby-related protein 1
MLRELQTGGKNVMVLKNRLPKFNEGSKKFSMNFYGRVKVASIKNFQLYHQNERKKICHLTILSLLADFTILQFGRTGQDTFALDVFYPLTPIEAFSIALTTFDAFENA